MEDLTVRFLTLAMSAFLVASFSPPVANTAGESINVGPAGDPAVEEIKQKLITGTMTDDLFVSYAGSLFQGPDLTKNTVLHKLRLKILLTWKAIMETNEKVKKEGLISVIQTYADSCSAQDPTNTYFRGQRSGEATPKISQ